MMVHALKCVTFIISPTWNTRHVVRRNYTNKVQKFKTDKSAVTSSVGMKGEQGNNKWRVNDPAVECDNEFRCNDFSIQMLSRSLFEQIFGKVKGKPERCNEELIAKSLQELKKHGLPGNMEKVADVSLRLPTIFNDNIEEHFYEIGRQQSEPYRMLIDQFVKVEIPQMPHEWRLVAGWTKYDGEVAESVDYPSEDVLIFDVEICCLEGENPVLATAVGARHWYSWVSKDLCAKRRAASKKNIYEYSTEELIPMETSPDVKGYRLGDRCLKPKAVIGHSVSFDRARIKEQYWLDRTGLRFVDTMSLHIAVSGVTSFQKAMLKSGAAKDESWVEFASLNNSLNEVHKFYCGGLELKKELRGIFVSGHLEDVKKNFQRLVTYCAEDVMATHRIFTRLWPLFLERFPHPVTLAGMLELSSCYLPVNRNWRRYLENAQQTFDDMNVEAKLLLSEQADKSCQLLHGEKYKRNIWMWSENWQVKPFSLNKVERSQRTTKKTKNETFAAAIATLASTTSDETKKKTRGKEEEEKDEEEEFDGGKKRQLENKFSSLLRTSKRLPLRIPYLAGYPEWYRKLCYAPRTADWKPGPQSISTSMKVIPKVLSLTWNCMPLHYVNGQGWCYIVPYKTSLPLPHDEISAFPLSDFIRYCRRIRGENRLTNDNKLEFETEAAVAVGAAAVAACGLVKLPHKNGADLNVGNPLARDFINHFAGVDNRNAVQIIEISRQLSYWKNNKDRIEGQYVVWLSDKDVVSDLRLHGIGVILPMVTVSGTLTRRAVEPTWMTASNAVDERIGSELKAMIQAPPGYCMVGADVDSQELWIASLIGDSYHAKQHGCTPFGWMTLSGQKSDETDMHSVTAKSMGVSRADAKIINYARIYGAGEKFANRLLKQFVPGIDEARAASVARKMMRNTKGRRIYQLKADVLPEQKQRIFSSSGARQLSALYGKQVDELFGRPKWSDGSESAMFNSLEEIACSEKPETPFLGSRLTKALEPVADRHQRFMPTRINWVVQSSAVDFLHLILVCMRWLIDPRIRFSLSFHDEVRYLVPQSEKYQTALALHVTNLLTRCFCVQRLGMRDLPQSVAFFSAVEVDTVLRKDSTHDCITPSNPHGLSKGYGIPPGESLNIHQCIEKANGKIGAIKIPKTIR